MPPLSLLSAVILSAALSLHAAPAAARDCGRFSAEIPLGWHVEEAADDLLVLRAPHADAVVTVTGGMLPDKTSARDMLESFINYFSGDEPRKREDGKEEFRFLRHGVRNTGLFSSDGKHYVFLTVTDPANRYPESIAMLIAGLILRPDSGEKQP